MDFTSIAIGDKTFDFSDINKIIDDNKKDMEYVYITGYHTNFIDDREEFNTFDVYNNLESAVDSIKLRVIKHLIERKTHWDAPEEEKREIEESIPKIYEYVSDEEYKKIIKHRKKSKNEDEKLYNKLIYLKNKKELIKYFKKHNCIYGDIEKRYIFTLYKVKINYEGEKETDGEKIHIFDYFKDDSCDDRMGSEYKMLGAYINYDVAITELKKLVLKEMYNIVIEPGFIPHDNSCIIKKNGGCNNCEYFQSLFDEELIEYLEKYHCIEFDNGNKWYNIVSRDIKF